MSNPIIGRELTGILRTRKAAVLQIGVAVLFALIVLLRWPSEAQVDISGAQAQRVFRIFGYGLLGMILLFLPAFPAGSIVRERRSGTLALLFNSPMPPWSIYLGKLAGSLGFAAILLTLSLPGAMACYSMGGGVTFGDVARLYGLLAIAAWQVTALALLVSTWARSTDSALRVTYALGLAVAVIAPAGYLFFQGQSGLIPGIAGWLRAFSPIPALLEILRQSGVGSRGLVTDSPVAFRYMMLAIGGSIAIGIWTIARLNSKLFDRSRSAGVITDDRSGLQRATRRAVFLIDPQRRKAGIGPLLNPVMVKEFRCRPFGRIHWLLRLVAVCALASLGLTYLTTAGTIDWGVETIGGILVVLQSALLLLITPSLAAVLISAERESGGWPLLQTTPLSARRILTGKIMSVVWTLALVLLATLPGYVVMVYIEPAMKLQIMRVVLCLLMTALFALAAGACIGGFFRRTAIATMVSYGVLLAICGGTLLVWLGRNAPFGHSTVEAALTINPVAAALSVIDVPGFEPYELVPANWWVLGIASAILLLILTFQTWRLTRPE